MTGYERQGWVDAPLDAVWAFHSTVDGLAALTPGWFRLRVESVVGPDGEPGPDVLDTGSEVRLSVRPFGVGPRQSWVSRITHRERGDDGALFRDVMHDGPFRTWIHTHHFRAVGGVTLVTDRVVYELPSRPYLRPAFVFSAFARSVLGLVLAHRHRRMRSELSQPRG